MTSFIAAGGSGRSTTVIPAVPAAWSVTTIAFIQHLPVSSPRLRGLFGSTALAAPDLGIFGAAVLGADRARVVALVDEQPRDRPDVPADRGTARPVPCQSFQYRCSFQGSPWLW
jgi:hypothetical protein